MNLKDNLTSESKLMLEPDEEVSLDDALNMFLHEGSEEKEEESVLDQGQAIRAEILSLFLGRADAPEQGTIDAWKAKHDGAVYVFAADARNVFVYTHLTVSQWEKIQQVLQQKSQAAPEAQQAIEAFLKEKVLREVILWPELSKTFFKTCPAGLPNTLYELIMLQSYFLNPQQAISLTTQL